MHLPSESVQEKAPSQEGLKGNMVKPPQAVIPWLPPQL